MTTIFVVKIIKTDTPIYKNLWSSFDKTAMDEKAAEYNAKNLKGVRYEVEEVKFLAEEINDDDF